MSTQYGMSPGYPDGNHDFHFWSYHPNLCQFLWADGAGQPLSYDINFSVFQAISTRRRRGSRPGTVMGLVPLRSTVSDSSEPTRPPSGSGR